MIQYMKHIIPINWSHHISENARIIIFFLFNDHLITCILLHLGIKLVLESETLLGWPNLEREIFQKFEYGKH